jgi:hypothetical protein
MTANRAETATIVIVILLGSGVFKLMLNDVIQQRRLPKNE